jgi:hypothetical protein
MLLKVGKVGLPPLVAHQHCLVPLAQSQQIRIFNVTLRGQAHLPNLEIGEVLAEF